VPDPQALATLAIQMLQPRLAGIYESEKQLSGRHLDNDFLDALKRAESLFNMATGLSDTDVDAYQLFKDEDDPMSFGDIEKRFKEFGWGCPCSENIIKDYVPKLIHEAHRQIESQNDRDEIQLSQAMGYPIGISGLNHRIRRHLVSMINRTRLNRLPLNCDQFAEQLADDFIGRIRRSIPGPQESCDAQDHFDSYLARSRFIPYVCDGLSYERFMGEDHLNKALYLDRASSILFYLKELGVLSSRIIRDPSQLKEQLRKLHLLIRSSDGVPAEVGDRMESCINMLNSDAPDMKGVSAEAVQAARALEAFRDHWWFRNLWSLQPAERLKKALEKHATAMPRVSTGGNATAEISPVEDARQRLISLLDESSACSRQDAAPCSQAKYRALLCEIKDCARVILESMQSPTDDAAPSNLSDMLKRIGQAEEDGIRAQAGNKDREWIDVAKLLGVLTKWSDTKRIRPYEIFLFAAQAGLQEKYLVCKQSALAAKFIPFPKCTSSESILLSHGGNKLEPLHDEEAP